MNNGFGQIGSSHLGMGGENSFWPAFTDVMMVITLIFLMATSMLVVRNWQLVAELQESVAAELISVQMIESTSLENATLEELLANAEQGNSILRLRLMKKAELLGNAQLSLGERESSIMSLEQENLDLQSSLQLAQVELDAANQEVNANTARSNELAQQITQLHQLLAQRQQASDDARAQLDSARLQISELSESSNQQQQTISQLSTEKSQLSQETTASNQQLLTLTSEYELIKSQYEELIKPARSAKGKHIAQVYYVKNDSGIIIRYRQPGDAGFSRLSLAEVERRLTILKREYGEQLYIKIIIPEDSGLTYNEAWEFMRKLLAKYDYYYQE
ncbi:MAG: DNA repair exonuclease SbcCD ATPase subunit [Cellvibrionaceae bacterium]|jgi:DNA repair exonuclease SbcCD ATPase subunit